MSGAEAFTIASPHRRRNPLTGRYLLVSPQRGQRPWLGQREAGGEPGRPPYDPTCYLCPGNTRAGGLVNPRYQGTFVFDNDFPALERSDAAPPPADELFTAEPVSGLCRVVCFSPRHDLSLAELSLPELAAVIEVWAQETEALGRRFRWVQVFENKGAVMGCSNPHPHGQIWASSVLPDEPAAEDAAQRDYFARHGTPLLLDYAERERRAGERHLCGNAWFDVIVPYWAVWPFETLILPRQPAPTLPALGPEQRAGLAEILSLLMRAYDRLFDVSFPYSFGWHGAPAGGAAPAAHWQLHGHVYPPLFRSATVKKFMVGYEMLAEPQRDLTPEAAAARLRACL